MQVPEVHLGTRDPPQRPAARELADGPRRVLVEADREEGPPAVRKGRAVLPRRELWAEEGPLPLLLHPQLLHDHPPQALHVLLVPGWRDEAVAVQPAVGEVGVEDPPQQCLVLWRVGRGTAAADAAPEVAEGLHDGHHDVDEVGLLRDARGHCAAVVDDHLPQLLLAELLEVDRLPRQHTLVGLLGLREVELVQVEVHAPVHARDAEAELLVLVLLDLAALDLDREAADLPAVLGDLQLRVGGLSKDTKPGLVQHDP
mmetsp:Transcript_67681/g.187695  ORF Transcript_67681/g.187695 Transcript_67681/m.187695 type:complete len:257 (-) Transcript_67681:255-1025(-)